MHAVCHTVNIGHLNVNDKETRLYVNNYIYFDIRVGIWILETTILMLIHPTQTGSLM